MFKWKRIIVSLSVVLALYVTMMFYLYAIKVTSSDYQKPTKTNAQQSDATQNLPDALVIGVKKGNIIHGDDDFFYADDSNTPIPNLPW